jgi:hypothetical protein
MRAAAIGACALLATLSGGCDAARTRTPCAPTCDGRECGPDGCGGTCGGCDPGMACTGLGTCEDCAPKDCDALGIRCGTASDGCGGRIDCGACRLPETCGGGGAPGVCGCTPATCEGGRCGTFADGCGGSVTCPGCPAGQTCGAGPAPNTCGTGMCTPETDRAFCARLGRSCGPTNDFDNCEAARSVNCGDCPPPLTCGGGGAPGVCGCETDAVLCARLGWTCGVEATTDACGSPRTPDCGACPGPGVCGGGGEAHRCGCEDDAAFCARLGAECGELSAADNCGQPRRAACGTCAGVEVCGAGGQANRCGCVPEQDAELCARRGAACGSVTVRDRCGATRTVACGTCPQGTVCGGGGVPGACGCEDDRALCARLGLECGAASGTDNCGAGRNLSCGSCSAPDTCGGGGAPNRCGSPSFGTFTSPVTRDLNSIHGTAWDDVWAVGDGGVIVHYDGSAWAAPSAPVPVSSRLFSVWALTRTDAFAVGEQGVALRWDGARWSQMATSYSNNLRGLYAAGPSDVWAGTADRGVLLHWDGSTWSTVSTGGTAFIRDIGGVGPSPVFAVENAGRYLYLANGSWREQWALSPLGFDFYGVWARDPSDVWMVGYYHGARHPSFFHVVNWVGAEVSEPTGLTARLWGVWAGATDLAWAVGDGGVIARYNGTAWGTTQSPTTSPLYDVFGTDRDVWAVGGGGTILRAPR